MTLPTAEMLAAWANVRQFVRDFQAATGYSLQLVPAALPQDTLPNWAGQNPFYRALMASVAGQKVCLAPLTKLWRNVHRPTSVRYIRGVGGLRHAAVPVCIGGRPVGIFLVGQICTRPPHRRDFQPLAATLRRHGHPRRQLQLVERAHCKLPVYSPKQFKAAVNMVRLFVADLVQTVESRRLPLRAEEPRCVREAKQYIHDHLDGPLGLAELIKPAGLCREHFCRQFKKSTGLTVTDYILRLRIERAKQLLADPTKRVAEAALESGFNTIPYFNRVFREHTGLTPTAYRRRLC